MNLRRILTSLVFIALGVLLAVPAVQTNGHQSCDGRLVPKEAPLLLGKAKQLKFQERDGILNLGSTSLTFHPDSDFHKQIIRFIGSLDLGGLMPVEAQLLQPDQEGLGKHCSILGKLAQEIDGTYYLAPTDSQYQRDRVMILSSDVCVQQSLKARLNGIEVLLVIRAPPGT